MSRHAVPIELSLSETAQMERIIRSGKAERRLVERVKIVLSCGRGGQNVEVARELGVRPDTVAKWRGRFVRDRLAGLTDAPRSGKPRSYDEETEARILAKLEEPPPEGHATWNGELLARALGDVSAPHVWRVLRKRSVSLARRRSWCVSTDPEFQRKATDIVGLYLSPPENALVLCVDEKPGIQALERAQGWLKMPDGRALTGFSHEYKRNGTTNLYAALEVATGMVKAGHFRRKRKVDFMAFLDEALSDVSPERAAHVILDNLSSHKNLPESWTRRHPNVTFHYTPTHASWLNQVETWFSILWRGALKGASFRTVRELTQAMDRFIAAYNERAHPFSWRRPTTKPKSLSHSLANL